jgi:hypothetical protein
MSSSRSNSDQFKVTSGGAHDDFLAMRSKINLIVHAEALKLAEHTKGMEDQPTVDQFISQILGNIYYQSLLAHMERMTARVIDKCRDNNADENGRAMAASELVQDLHHEAGQFINADKALCEEHLGGMVERILGLAHFVSCNNCSERFMKIAVERAEYMPSVSKRH